MGENAIGDAFGKGKGTFIRDCFAFIDRGNQLLGCFTDDGVGLGVEGLLHGTSGVLLVQYSEFLDFLGPGNTSFYDSGDRIDA